tara:strand:+ start:1657 stop:2490 length:834 start_codon:yes stop_codon:yes gene_type:complete
MASIINAATSGGLISTADTSGILQLQTAGTTAVTVDASQNVGIGTASPAYKLDLYTTAQFSGRWSNATRGGYFYTDSGGPGIFNTPAYGGEGMYFHAGSNYIQFITNSNENMRLDSAGGLKTKNTIGVGDATPSTSGAGITFPATQSASSNANTLDDYEEGTWTPAVTGGTLTVNAATYTKIGNQVLIAFDVKFTSVAAGAITITGLPFSTGGADAGIGALGGDKYSFASALTLTSSYFQGTTVFFFYQTSGANGVRMTDANITGDTTVRASATYKV